MASKSETERKARLAEALRANLKRRKAQARMRGAAERPETSPQAQTGTSFGGNSAPAPPTSTDKPHKT